MKKLEIGEIYEVLKLLIFIILFLSYFESLIVSVISFLGFISTVIHIEITIMYYELKKKENSDSIAACLIGHYISMVAMYVFAIAHFGLRIFYAV